MKNILTGWGYFLIILGMIVLMFIKHVPENSNNEPEDEFHPKYWFLEVIMSIIFGTTLFYIHGEYHSFSIITICIVTFIGTIKMAVYDIPEGANSKRYRNYNLCLSLLSLSLIAIAITSSYYL